MSAGNVQNRPGKSMKERKLIVFGVRHSLKSIDAERGKVPNFPMSAADPAPSCKDMA
jgi:hypothetical protein